MDKLLAVELCVYVCMSQLIDLAWLLFINLILKILSWYFSLFTHRPQFSHPCLALC